MPTLWSVAKNRGLKVASLLWPVSAQAPVDYNIPDIGGMGEKVREQYSKPEGFVDEIKRNVFNNEREIEYGKNVNIAKIAAYVIKKDEPNLMTVHFFSVDGAQHIAGREGSIVRFAVLDADSGIAIIKKSLQDAGIWDETVLIVTGDHGFVTVKTIVQPNVWLAKAGLITNKKMGEWKAQFLSEDGSCFLYLKNADDKETLQRVKDILNDLPEEQKSFFKIIDKKKLDSVGADPNVQLALTGLNNAYFEDEYKGEDIKKTVGGTHGYFPDIHEVQTGFIIHGPGIKKGSVITKMNLRDIAPLVAKLLDIPFPTADGHIPEGILVK